MAERGKQLRLVTLLAFCCRRISVQRRKHGCSSLMLILYAIFPRRIKTHPASGCLASTNHLRPHSETCLVASARGQRFKSAERIGTNCPSASDIAPRVGTGARVRHANANAVSGEPLQFLPNHSARGSHQENTPCSNTQFRQAAS